MELQQGKMASSKRLAQESLEAALFRNKEDEPGDGNNHDEEADWARYQLARMGRHNGMDLESEVAAAISNIHPGYRSKMLLGASAQALSNEWGDDDDIIVFPGSGSDCRKEKNTAPEPYTTPEQFMEGVKPGSLLINFTWTSKQYSTSFLVAPDENMSVIYKRFEVASLVRGDVFRFFFVGLDITHAGSPQAIGLPPGCTIYAFTEAELEQGKKSRLEGRCENNDSNKVEGTNGSGTASKPSENASENDKQEQVLQGKDNSQGTSNKQDKNNSNNQGNGIQNSNAGGGVGSKIRINFEWVAAPRPDLNTLEITCRPTNKLSKLFNAFFKWQEEFQNSGFTFSHSGSELHDWDARVGDSNLQDRDVIHVYYDEKSDASACESNYTPSDDVSDNQHDDGSKSSDITSNDDKTQVTLRFQCSKKGAWGELTVRVDSHELLIPVLLKALRVETKLDLDYNFAYDGEMLYADDTIFTLVYNERVNIIGVAVPKKARRGRPPKSNNAGSATGKKGSIAKTRKTTRSLPTRKATRSLSTKRKPRSAQKAVFKASTKKKAAAGERTANTRPENVRQQVDNHVRKQIEGMQLGLQQAQRMSIPEARSNAYLSPQHRLDATEEEIDQQKWPWVIHAAACFTEQRPNGNGQNEGGEVWLPKPQLHFMVGSDMAAAKLKEVLAPVTGCKVCVHTTFEDYRVKCLGSKPKNPDRSRKTRAELAEELDILKQQHKKQKVKHHSKK